MGSATETAAAAEGPVPAAEPPPESTPATSADPGPTPLAQPPLKEIRLAIVMYGGVSLAIYMNGVSQELFHLVRATASSAPPSPGSRDDQGIPSATTLSSTEPVYRALAELMDSDVDDRELNLDQADSLDRHPALVRFVIDVVSGSSAGGINGIFLAKALANDQPLEPLGKLWVDQGDISKLLNDKRSVKDLPKEQQSSVKPETPPPSLLNGRRMYLELLQAMTDMELPISTDGTRSRLADELDLWVTTTDLQGLLLPIRLSNRVTWERRYRTVFHFKYARGVGADDTTNDFHQGNNPFLAFAARSTSSFPWAFQPVELDDIHETVLAFPQYRSAAGAAGADPSAWAQAWDGFYNDYRGNRLTGDGPGPGSIPFTQRAFGDGGALDNKPFTYATSTLLRRHADVPVDRKLLFVEPDPGHPEWEKDVGERPDALENFLKQGVLLPRQEVIREDLQALFDRNRVIGKVDTILEELDSVVTAQSGEGDALRAELDVSAGANRVGQDAATVRERGTGYAGYQRLRVEAVTDDLAALVTRAAGLPDEPEIVDAVRHLVVAWRQDNYSDSAIQAVGGSPDNRRPRSEFLYQFDLGYRLRRLNLLQRRIDRLWRLEQAAERMLEGAGLTFPATPDVQNEFRDELIRTKVRVNDAYYLLRSAGRALRQRPSDPGEAGPQASPAVPPPQPSISDLLKATGVTLDVLRKILSRPSGPARREAARNQYERTPEVRQAFIDLGTKIAADLGTARGAATSVIEEALGPHPAGVGRQTARDYLVRTYNSFEEYDAVAFPLLYASDAGEADIVEVIRVSPMDAMSLVNSDEPGTPPKLTGTKYMHFGAFLSREWRQRDILWGRLDAADILLNTLLAPDATDDHRKEQAGRLLAHAQRVIVDEQITRAEREEIAGLLANVVNQSRTAGPVDERQLLKILKGTDPPLNARTVTVLKAIAGDAGLLVEYVKDSASEIEPLPRKDSLEVMGRGAHIMGDVLKGVAQTRGKSGLGLPFIWLSRIGALFAGAVEAATPRSYLHLLWRHWLALLLIFEVLAIAGGSLLSAPGVVQFGVTALLVTLAAGLLVWSLSQYIRKRKWWVIPVVLVVLLFAGLVTLAVLELLHLGRSNSWIPIFGQGVPTPSPTGGPSPSP